MENTVELILAAYMRRECGPSGSARNHFALNADAFASPDQLKWQYKGV